MKNTSRYFKVIYEDNHLIAVDKAAGILVQGDETGDTPLSELVKEYIAKKYNKPGAVFCGVIHRLDRPVSGAIVLARTSKGLARMNALFKNREIRKIYWALTKDKPETESGTLVHWLKKNTNKNFVNVFGKETSGAQKAELNFKILGRTGGFYLWQIELKTGRPHQIRAQLAKIGCPIKGDVKYGFGKNNPDGSIHLHSKALIFEHPVKNEPIHIEAPLPNESTWNLFHHFSKVKDELDR